MEETNQGPILKPKQSTKPAVPVVTKKNIFSSRLIFILLPFIIGGIMLVVFFYPEYQQQQIIESGLPADAVVLGLRDTGNRYNDQPQVRLSVEVRPEGQEPYPATITMVISPVYMSEFQPGSKLKVRYDPEEPSRVAVEETELGTSYLPDEGEGNSTLFIILLSILPAPILFLIFFYLPQRRRRKILKIGVPAEAVVLKIEDTLTRINRQPKVRLSLEVRPKDKEVFQVEMTTVISPAHLAEFKPGSKLQVRYDPNDRSRIAIEQSSSGGQFRY